MTMKLGSGTGSVINHLYSRMTKGQPEPKVGDGATILGWTDRHPATVIEVTATKQGWVVAVQEDHAKRTDSNGMSEMQEYEYTPNPNGYVSHFRLEEGKGWCQVRPGKRPGSWKRIAVGGVLIGQRRKYYDFSF